MSKYKVLRDIENDKTEKQYKPGDIISSRDFTKDVIAHWLDKGILEMVVTTTKSKGKEE